MPYIDKKTRQEIESKIDFDAVSSVTSSGELNYIITRFLLATKPTRYQDYNKLIGVLECCKQEFYRRAVAPYEDKKRGVNGEVYFD